MSSDLEPRSTEETEPKKPSKQILRHELAEGSTALERSVVGLIISGFSAGLDIGFSLFVTAVFVTLENGQISKPLMVILTGNTYAIGFIFVVLGRSELFTEQTTLAVLPVLNGTAKFQALLRLWSVVFVANVAGAAVFAALAVTIGPMLGVIDPAVFGEIAHRTVGHHALTIFCSAVLAGWLMGLLSWLVAASRDTISQIVLVWLITAVIGLCRLHHVVVGSVDAFAGLFADQGITWLEVGRFLVCAALGNAVGGAFFVAVIKYSHAIRGRQEE